MEIILGYLVGFIIGLPFAMLLGALVGLVPLILGIVKKKIGLGIGGMGACIGGSAIAGFFLSVPLAILFTVLILVRPNKSEDQAAANGFVEAEVASEVVDAEAAEEVVEAEA